MSSDNLQPIGLKTLTNLVRSVSAATDEEELLRIVVQRIQESFGYDRVSIFLAEGNGELVLRDIAGGHDTDVQPGLRIAPREGLVGRAHAEETLVHVPDTGKDKDYREVPGLPARSELSAPIRLSERSVGVLDLQSERPNAFGTDDEDVLESVADLTGASLGRIRTLQRLRNQKIEAETALTRIREVEETKDRFISAVSHEFRTPLTSIRSFAEILLVHSQEDPETTREFITIIHDESVRLSRLVNDLLDLSKMQAGRMEWDFRPNRLSNAIRRASKSVASLAAQRKVEILVEDSNVPEFVFDRDKVIQILVNLLSNALKYSPDGAKVTIIPRSVEGGATITVRDQGPGIEPEHRAEVFERFQQVGGKSSRVPGTGLGLSISREIVAAHGGRIWVDEAPGGGSDFSFQLPLQPEDTDSLLAKQASETEETDAPALEQALEKKGDPRILVVDDDENFRRFLVFELDQLGLAVTQAEDGHTAIHVARTESPDLILLDMRMPGLTGKDVLTLLASDPATADIPVLVLSVAPEEESRGLPGVKNILRKPVNRSDLLKRVLELV